MYFGLGGVGQGAVEEGLRKGWGTVSEGVGEGKGSGGCWGRLGEGFTFYTTKTRLEKNPFAFPRGESFRPETARSVNIAYQPFLIESPGAPKIPDIWQCC